jgi:hypothetical protein
MLTFEEFLHSTAEKGEAINLMFEQRLFDLVVLLHKIAGPLSVERVPHELVGGPVLAITGPLGFRFRHAERLDMLLQRESSSARNAVRLWFSGEKVRPTQATQNPPVAPVRKLAHGERVAVISVTDLLRKKLSSWRLTEELQGCLQHVRESE